MRGLREFNDAAEMIAFYRDLQTRMRSLQAAAPKPPPEPPPVAPSPRRPTPVQRELRRTPLGRILLAVSEHSKIPVGVITSAKRTPDLVDARNLVFYLGKQLLNYSCAKLGSRVGGRDHSTVVHSLQSVTERMAVDDEYAGTVERLRLQLLEE